MREYLELEFSSLKKALEGKFVFNIENIIDDWVNYLIVGIVGPLHKYSNINAF